MSKIKEVDVEGEKVYLKKDFAGYRVVEPITNPDGSKNWLNILIGGKRNRLALVFIIVLLFFAYMGVNELISDYKVIAERPCDYCKTCQVSQLVNLDIPHLNITGIG